jgi:hypothetical protein
MRILAIVMKPDWQRCKTVDGKPGVNRPAFQAAARAVARGPRRLD